MYLLPIGCLWRGFSAWQRWFLLESVLLLAMSMSGMLPQCLPCPYQPQRPQSELFAGQGLLSSISHQGRNNYVRIGIEKCLLPLPKNKAYDIKWGQWGVS